MVKRYKLLRWITAPLIMLSASLPKIVFAAGLGLGLTIPGTTTAPTTYIDYIRAMFKFALEAGVALTTLMVIYAGIRYMTSQGNQSALNEAKDIMIGSISGLAMLSLIALILTIMGLPVF